MLHFLVHKIFTFYTNGVLNCKCSAPGLTSNITLGIQQSLGSVQFIVVGSVEYKIKKKKLSTGCNSLDEPMGRTQTGNLKEGITKCYNNIQR